MKTRIWILLLSCLFLLCCVLSFFCLRPGTPALCAEIYSGGTLIKTVSLLEDQSFTVPAPSGGSNTVEISGGAIAVTSATCPDHHCIHRGFCSQGPSILCLPNALEIRFLKEAPVDISLH